MAGYLLGLDNGGTIIKAAIFDTMGKEIGVASRSTKMHTPRPGYTQRDMEELWQLNCQCIKEVLEATNTPPEEILGMALCGHGKGLYPWGKDGKPAYSGIVSTDNRAWEYPEKWRQSGVFENLSPRLCQQLIPCQQVSLLAWLKDNEPKVYKNIQWAFSVKDYLRFRLTGEAFCEATDISGSGLMNVRDAKFDRDIPEALGIGEAYEMLAPLKYSADMCGTITQQAARLTGLAPGTPVAGGMFDIDACAIAMAITEPHQLCSIIGTWSINEFISKSPVQIAMNSLYAIPGYYLIEECSATGAANLDWVLENIIGKEAQDPYAQANNMVYSVSAEDCDVYYLPFLYGSNTHSLAKASFVGLTSFHNKSHMVRAVFEGVAFSTKTHIDRLLSVRQRPKSLRLAGGIVNSPLWVQMLSDVLNIPIETVSGVTEQGALGAAMSAAVAAGVYDSYQQAAEAMVSIQPPIYPNPRQTAIYSEKFEKYKAITEALYTVWARGDL